MLGTSLEIITVFVFDGFYELEMFRKYKRRGVFLFLVHFRAKWGHQFLLKIDAFFKTTFKICTQNLCQCAFQF